MMNAATSPEKNPGGDTSSSVSSSATTSSNPTPNLSSDATSSNPTPNISSDATSSNPTPNLSSDATSSNPTPNLSSATTSSNPTPNLSSDATDSNGTSSRETVYTTSDIRLKLVRIWKEVCRQNVFQLFLWGTKDKAESTPLDKYLFEERKWSKYYVNKKFSKKDLEKMKDDPKKETIDFILLCKIISGAIHNEEYPRCFDGEDVISSLNQVKDVRNDLMYRNNTFDSTAFIVMVERVRSLLTKMLEEAGAFYSIDESSVKKTTSQMNHDIDSIRDGTTSPQDMQSCRDDLIFADLVNQMRDIGNEELKELYTRNEITYVNPFGIILDCNWNDMVERAFTSPTFTDELHCGPTRYIEYEDIVLFNNPWSRVTFVEGVAGIGKTTITQHIVSQWCCNDSFIEDLGTYDLLLLMECRNSSLSSLSELLESLMSKTRQQFQDEDLLPIFQQQKSLILVDSLDEMNDNSRKLLKDILELTKTYENTHVLAFSHSERPGDFYDIVQEIGYEVSHIKVEEIRASGMDAFIEKYHEELKHQRQNDGDIKELLQYLWTTGRDFDQILGLPVNLVMLTVLWTLDPSRIKEIHTPTGLHLECLTLSIHKLCQRLRDKLPFSVDEVKKKIRIFLFGLSKLALEALREDVIVGLTSDQILRLQEECDRLGLPPDEVIGAFLKLKKNQTGTDTLTSVSFTHKSQQDFLASLFMNHVILGGSRGEPPQQEQLMETENSLLKSGHSPSAAQGIITSASQDLQLMLDAPETHPRSPSPPRPQVIPGQPASAAPASSGSPAAKPKAPSFMSRILKNLLKVTQANTPSETSPRTSYMLDILKDLCKGNQNENLKMEKFKDPLLHLLRLMHRKGPILPDTAHQMVQILKESGVGYCFPFGSRFSEDTQWLLLLSEVSQDTVAKAVADMLRKKHQNGEDDVVNFGTLYVYDKVVRGALLLFRHIIPTEVKNRVDHLTIEDPTKSEWEEILQLLAKEKVKVRCLHLEAKSSPPEAFAHLVPEVMLRCKVEDFSGRLKYLGKKKIPSVFEAELKIMDDDDAVVPISKRLPRLAIVQILVEKGVSPSLLTPSSGWLRELNFRSMTEGDVEWGIEIAKALQPLDPEEEIHIFHCSESHLGKEGFASFVQRLLDAGVRMDTTLIL